MVRPDQIKGVIWHHTGGTNSDPLASTIHHTADIIDASHKTRWPGFTSKFFRNSNGEFFHCGYTYVIETQKRTIVQTRKVGEETAAAVGYNTYYIHVVNTGNYDIGADKWDDNINPKVVAVWKEIKKQCPHLKIKDNWPHRFVASKTCFGNSREDNHIQEIIAKAELDDGKTEREIQLEMQVAFLERVNRELVSLVYMLYELLTGKRLNSRQK